MRLGIKINTGFDLTKYSIPTQRALANHFYLKTEEAWKAGNEKKTGQFLKSATVNIEHTYDWVGKELKTQRMVFQEARNLSLRLIEQSAKDPAEVNKTLAAIKTDIDDLGKVK